MSSDLPSEVSAAKSLFLEGVVPLPDLAAEEDLDRALRLNVDIWQRVDDVNYTVHDWRHSASIVKHLNRLDDIWHWSPYERLLLRLAALTHDLGMQFNSWGGRSAAEDGSRQIWEILLETPTCGRILAEHDIKPPLTGEEVRRLHVPLGAALIEAELCDQRTWAVPPPMLAGRQSSKLMGFGAWQIAFAHSDGTWWDKCCDPGDTFYKTRHLPEYEEVRLRLLAAAFRLADELDSHFARVPEMERLWADDVTDLSRLHWLASFFVSQTEVKVDSGLAVITLHWQAPYNADGDLVRGIRDLVFEMRERRINREITRVNEMLRDTANADLRLNALVKMGEDPEPHPLGLSPRFVELVRNFRSVLESVGAAPAAGVTRGPTVAIAPGKGGNRPSEATRNAPPSIAPGATVPNGSVGVRVPRRAIERTIEERIEDWYLANRRSLHVELENGGHTNVYLNCRTLISQPDLVRAVRNRIVTDLQEDPIDMVVAIGSSVVPLAVEVATRWGVGATFTFHEPSKRLGLPRRSEFEAHAILPRGIHRVLLLDDVVASGAAVLSVVTQLRRQRRSLRDVPMAHVALLRMGTLPLDGLAEAGITTTYYCEYPDVYYAPSEEQCSLCQDGEPLRRESDLELPLL